MAYIMYVIDIWRSIMYVIGVWRSIRLSTPIDHFHEVVSYRMTVGGSYMIYMMHYVPTLYQLTNSSLLMFESCQFFLMHVW